MRTRVTVAALLIVPAAFVYACGGDNGTDIGDGGGNDGTVQNDTGTGKDGSSGSDTGTGSDAGTGSDTGTTQDSGTTKDSGTTTQDSGTTQDGSFGCQKPSDCTTGFCCGTVVFNGGKLPNCNLASATSQCETTCKSNVQLSCTATDTVRGCAAKNDCLDAGSGYTSCCNVPFGDASVEFCWSATLAGYVGGTCL